MKKVFAIALIAFSAFVNAATLSPVTMLNPTGSTSGQAIISSGPGSAPAWGNVTAAALSAQAANTVVANATGSSGSPSAFAMPSCNTTSSALIWTPGTGFQCSTAINAAALGGTAASSYALLATPTFTGTPTAPTATAGTSTTQIATTAFTQTAITGGGSAAKFTSLALTASAKVFAFNTSAQSIANNSNVVVTGWTASTNQNSNFVASTGIFTAPRAGFYQVSAGLGFVSGAFTAGQNVAVLIMKNAGAIIQGVRSAEVSVTTPQYAPPVSVLVQCAAGDTLSIAAFQNSGSALALNSGGTAVWMSISEAP